MKCPTCRKEAPYEGNPCRPFCSERCKLIDLGKWASDAFRVPGERVSLDADGEDGRADDLFDDQPDAGR